MGEVAGAFGGTEGVEGLADGVPEGVDGSGRGGAEQRLELGEQLFDRVQIGAVGRQVEQPGAARRDRFAPAVDLVGAEVVHDH
jgi:hypothetical protein